MHRAVTIAIPSLPPVRVLLGRITGAAEAALMPGRAGEATRLLDALALAPDGAALDLARLPASVHDRLLAEVFRAEVGEHARCRAQCGFCSEPFEFGLTLTELIAAQNEAAAQVGPPDADGCWQVGERRVRVPLLGDTGEPAMLAALCDPGPATEAEVAAVEAFLERAAPLLSLDLDTVCPHCEAEQALAFDLPCFLLTALANEQPFLIRETHLIASRYGWSHAEILALPRDQRRAFAGLIESERSAALRQRRAG